MQDIQSLTKVELQKQIVDKQIALEFKRAWGKKRYYFGTWGVWNKAFPGLCTSKAVQWTAYLGHLIIQ